MTNFKRLFTTALAVFMLVGTLGLAGCGGVSPEQIAELESLRAEVDALEKEVEFLKAEKTKLEREIAEQNARLKDCDKLKKETKENLEKMGM